MSILAAEVDRENLLSFMLEQGLFGIQLFEHLLLNREYCDAFYTFRRLGLLHLEGEEEAFLASHGW